MVGGVKYIFLSGSAGNVRRVYHRYDIKTGGASCGYSIPEGRKVLMGNEPQGRFPCRFCFSKRSRLRERV